MKQTTKKLLRGLLLLTPMLLACAGLTRAGEKPIDALFAGLTMYALNFTDPPANFLVQLARWTAPLAAAGGIMLLFAPLVRRIRARLMYLLGDSVAVYGEREFYQTLKKNLNGVFVTQGTDKLLSAHRYVLFMGEEENLRFYLENRESLAEREVYLRCASLRSQEMRGGHLHLYSAEEVGARLYWKQADLFSQFAASGPELRIALIGFGALGEQLLFWGLQDNVFSPEQKISYDVFGDPEGFLNLHHELDWIGDPVRFYGDWKEHIELLQRADRILVCRQEEQLLLIEELLFALSGKTLDVLAARPTELTLLEAAERLRVFAWKEAALLPENLFDDRTLARAKAINLRYAHLYMGTEETPENAEAEWNSLNSFTRYSNISAADYHEIRLQMMERWGCAPGAEISPEQLELLAELEHIRWCRFHWLNNWRYGEAVGGKAKNAAAKTHADLLPFAELSDKEKEKDRESIRTLLRIRFD